MTVEATLEHPFFVFGQGWSSCSPQRTLQRYGLQCSKLLVGDVCISLTHKDTGSQAAVLAASQQLHGQPEPSSQISEQRGGGATELWRPTDRPHTVSTSASVSATASTASPSRSLRTVTPKRVGSETRHTPNTSHPEISPSTPRDAQSGQAGYPTNATRRRRWSAPDQLPLDNQPLRPAGSPAIAQPPTPAPPKEDSGDSKAGKKPPPDKDKDSDHSDRSRT